MHVITPSSSCWTLNVLFRASKRAVLRIGITQLGREVVLDSTGTPHTSHNISLMSYHGSSLVGKPTKGGNVSSEHTNTHTPPHVTCSPIDDNVRKPNDQVLHKARVYNSNSASMYPNLHNQTNVCDTSVHYVTRNCRSQCLCKVEIHCCNHTQHLCNVNLHCLKCAHNGKS